jgi:hypothetical protein
MVFVHDLALEFPSALLVSHVPECQEGGVRSRAAIETHVSGWSDPTFVQKSHRLKGRSGCGVIYRLSIQAVTRCILLVAA